MSGLFKHPAYGTCYSDPMLTPTGRLAWPSLVKPKDAPPAKEGEQQGAPRYEVTIIMPKSDPYTKKWEEGVQKVCAEMLVLFNQGRKAKISVEEVLKDGNSFDLEKYPYYKDTLLLVARNVKLAPLVDGKKQEIPAEKFLGGCMVRGTVTPIMTGWGLSYKLEALQLVKDDGVRFAGSNRSGSYVDLLPSVEADPIDEGIADGAEEVMIAKTGKAKALDML